MLRGAASSGSVRRRISLGFLLVLVGVGEPAATTAGCVLLLAHALFKAALFLVVGIVDHEAGTRDAQRLGGLLWLMPFTGTLATVAAASMAGVLGSAVAIRLWNSWPGRESARDSRRS